MTDENIEEQIKFMEKQIETLAKMNQQLRQQISETESQKESEYNKADRGSDNQPLILTPEDYKLHLARPSVNNLMELPEDVLTQDLTLSSLDVDNVYISKIRLHAVEGWNNLGMPETAKRRLTHLNGTLALFRSVNSLERIFQAANINVNHDLNTMSGLSKFATTTASEEGGKSNTLQKFLGLKEQMKR